MDNYTQSKLESYGFEVVKETTDEWISGPRDCYDSYEPVTTHFAIKGGVQYPYQYILGWIKKYEATQEEKKMFQLIESFVDIK